MNKFLTRPTTQLTVDEIMAEVGRRKKIRMMPHSESVSTHKNRNDKGIEVVSPFGSRPATKGKT